MVGAHPIDWTLYGDWFSALAVGKLFNERETVIRWLGVEQALMCALADVGLAPEEAVEAIIGITVEDLDWKNLQKATIRNGRPIAGLVDQLRQLVGEPHARWVHFSATTQDILDTALILQLRDALVWFDDVLRVIRAEIERLEVLGENAVMIGRTNGLHAEPVTLELKCGVWEAEFARHAERLEQLRPRLLNIQLAGPVGTLDAAGKKRDDLRIAFAAELGLGLCEPHWQNARDSISEFVSALGLVAASVAKISQECATLAGDDLRELCFAAPGDQGRSSAMPHKRNLRALEFAEGLSRQAMQRATGTYDTMLHKHERSAAPWISEWLIVPEVCLLTSGALSAFERGLSELEPDHERMRNNLEASLELMQASRIQRELAKDIGFAAAQNIIDAAISAVHERGVGFTQALEMHPDYQHYVEQQGDKALSN